MKQSSIEWLHSEYKRIFGSVFVEPQMVIEISESLAKAKEMHKQEVIDAFWNGDNTDCLAEQNAKEFAEQYYNDKFKTESNGTT